MILKTLFVGVLGLAFCVNLSSAQYLHHYQSWYAYNGENPFQRREWNTKALTPVREKSSQDNQKLRTFWAYASTVSSKESNRVKNALLVKMDDNKTPNPFRVLWAKEYFQGDNADIFAIDVEDVYHYNAGRRSEYIMCGKVRRRSQGKTEGFLLRIRGSGAVLNFATYPTTSVLTSVVPTDDRRIGYVAVGKTIRVPSGNDNIEATRDAVYMYVNTNLVPRCLRALRGEFEDDLVGDEGVESGFNKVIRYKNPNSNSPGYDYAVVGTTTVNPGDTCREDSDVVVAVFGRFCSLQWVSQYGAGLQQTSAGQSIISETGKSIAQTIKGDLVITGNTINLVECQQPLWNDVLVFMIRDFNVAWWYRYDVLSNTDVFGNLPDFGAAVQIRRFNQKENIVVAGEAETTYFYQSGRSLQPNIGITQDVFVMDLDMEGTPMETEVFGIFDGLPQGALRPGKLDLHLTQDRQQFSLVMGNTKVPPNEIVGSDLTRDASHPYLIERYNSRFEQCQDEETKWVQEKYDFKTPKPLVRKYRRRYRREFLKSAKVPIRQVPECDKKKAPSPTLKPFPIVAVTPKPTTPKPVPPTTDDLAPSASPTESPAPSPSPSETPTPPKPTFDIVSKTPKPSPKPTFPIDSKTAPPTNVPIEPDVKPKPTPSLVDNDTPGHWPTTPKPTFGIDVDVATRDPALPDIGTLAPVPDNDATLKPVPDITDITAPTPDGPN